MCLEPPELPDNAGELGRDIKSDAKSRDLMRATRLGPSSSMSFMGVSANRLSLSQHKSEYSEGNSGKEKVLVVAVVVARHLSMLGRREEADLRSGTGEHDLTFEALARRQTEGERSEAREMMRRHSM